MLKRVLANCGVLTVALLSACSGGGGGVKLPAASTGAAPATSAPATSGPAPVAASGAAAQTHVMTADYLGGYAGTHSVAASNAAPYLTWAETNSSDAGAISSAGIKTMEYLDPFRQAENDPLYSSDESTFSHDCSGGRIAIDYNGGTSHVTQYLMNPASSHLVTLLNTWEDAEESNGHFDAFYFDDMDDLDGVAAPCDISSSAWDASNSAFVQGSAYSIVFSGYSINGDASTLLTDSNSIGGVVEECYSRTSQPTPPYTTGSIWTHDENLELAAAAAGKQFFCYNNGGEDAASSTQLRLYVFASFLLTYSPASSVLWETFSTPSGLHVFPEIALVPTQPRISPGSVNDLKATSGLYVREYATCYLAGTSVGGCAVIVNADTSGSHALPPLSGSYSHTLTITGDGIVDGGTASATGAAPPAQVPPETGLIALQ